MTTREKDPKTIRIAVGMSGGVDSAVSAALLKEQGYDVTGVHMVCFDEPGCRAPEDRKDALAVALQLDIPFDVLDFQKPYKKKVIDYFYSEYKAGRTPNPDVMCNKEIKFGLFLEWALKNKFDYVATGHYARIRRMRKISNLKSQLPKKSQYSNSKSNRQFHYKLLRGKDQKKDQSYFLYVMTQKQLKHTLFPIGEMTKTQVRKEAKKRKLYVADKPDSQGICFLGDIDPQKFLRRRIKERKGNVVDMKGNVIGEHTGVWFYTIGQRHGFSVDHGLQRLDQRKRNDFPPLYVVGKDVVRNRLIVGIEKEAERDNFRVEDVHLISGESQFMNHELKDLKVRIRHGGKLIPFEPTFKGSTLQGVRLKEAQRGVAPGQSAVFYDGEVCLGGGVIS